MIEDGYEQLKLEIENCRKCDLWRGTKHRVIGEGPLDSRIMLVGLGPGYYENIEGRPFVGAAGKFLNNLLTLAGLERGKLYITNVIKCYLPDNKATDEQVKTCSHYLDRQIDMLKPAVLVALGSVAAMYLLGKYGLTYSSMSRLHGKIFKVEKPGRSMLIAVMYHPASALYNPSMKLLLEKDWRKLGEILSKIPV
ncbi:uracil-DNA glycosylase [Candidatus Bathyarchaeota archaeon]|nr:uracil-DNA glycosylase [Candidatus Bathyarchaeota archaeon]MBS7617952.1 uracil-DNA glycosylase [Candidatus Bathyarchaeota archaeon]